MIKQKSGLDLGSILDLVPLERGHSGRIVKLRIIGTKKTVSVGKDIEIRKWLSPSHLYSSAFWVEKKVHSDDPLPVAFTLLGAGWGHGVGMCQIGAAVMSQQGYGVNEILSHYFQHAQQNKRY